MGRDWRTGMSNTFILMLQIDCTWGVVVHKIPRSLGQLSLVAIGRKNTPWSLLKNWILFSTFTFKTPTEKCNACGRFKMCSKTHLNIRVHIRGICFHWVTLVGTEKKHEVGVQIRKILSTVTEESWLILQWLRNPSGLLPPQKTGYYF